MIKRLKWNTLYGGGGGEESDGGFSSSSEEGPDTITKERIEYENELLLKLAEQDPDISEVILQKKEALASSSEEEDDDSEEQGAREQPRRKRVAVGEIDSELESQEKEVDSTKENEANNVEASDDGEQNEDPNEKYVEWRECNLCPGKRFLNDKEVDAHIGSKKHMRAVAKLEKAQAAGQAQKELTENREPGIVRDSGDAVEPMAENKSGTDTPQSSAQKEKVQKRKKKAKQKLKALKRRKWEKQKQAEKESSEKAKQGEIPDNIAKAISNKKTNGEGNDEHIGSTLQKEGKNQKPKSSATETHSPTSDVRLDKKISREQLAANGTEPEPTNGKPNGKAGKKKYRASDKQSVRKRVTDGESLPTPKRSRKEKMQNKKSDEAQLNEPEDVPLIKEPVKVTKSLTSSGALRQKDGEAGLLAGNGIQERKPKVKKDKKKRKKNKEREPSTSPAVTKQSVEG